MKARSKEWFGVSRLGGTLDPFVLKTTGSIRQ